MKKRLLLELQEQPELATPVGVTRCLFEQHGGTIGRDETNHWVISDQEGFVSGQHAEIIFDGTDYRVKDLSTNGTWLYPEGTVDGNGVAVCKTEGTCLLDGQRLDISDFIIKVCIEAVEVTPEPPAFLTDPTPTIDTPTPAPAQPSERSETERVTAVTSPDIHNTSDSPIPVQPLHHFNNPVDEGETISKAAFKPTDDVDAVQKYMQSMDLDDPELFQQIVGQITAHLVKLLQRRDEVRQQFQLPVTGIKAHDNNPMALAINAHDALHNLFVKQIHGYMEPAEAYEDALDSVSIHQEALLSGMNAGFEFMLHSFSPEQLKQQLSLPETGSWLSSIFKQDDFINAYERYYEEMINDMHHSFQQLFGRAFAQAYERTSRSLSTDDQEAK